MKTELYHYAMSLDKKNLSNIPNLCVGILLTIFLIPILLSNIWIGILISFAYVLSYFRVKKENVKYCKELLNFAIFLLFLGLEFSLLIILRYGFIKQITITLFTIMMVYEIVFVLKIKLKMYSRSDKSSRPWIYIVSLVFGGTGIWCGRLIANNESTDLKLLAAIFLCAVLIIGSVSFFQKFFIYKIINR